jgi:hypothetical protein
MNYGLRSTVLASHTRNGMHNRQSGNTAGLMVLQSKTFTLVWSRPENEGRDKTIIMRLPEGLSVRNLTGVPLRLRRTSGNSSGNPGYTKLASRGLYLISLDSNSFYASSPRAFFLRSMEGFSMSGEMGNIRRSVAVFYQARGEEVQSRPSSSHSYSLRDRRNRRHQAGDLGIRLV